MIFTTILKNRFIIVSIKLVDRLILQPFAASSILQDADLSDLHVSSIASSKQMIDEAAIDRSISRVSITLSSEYLTVSSLIPRVQ